MQLALDSCTNALVSLQYAREARSRVHLAAAFKATVSPEKTHLTPLAGPHPTRFSLGFSFFWRTRRSSRVQVSSEVRLAIHRPMPTTASLLRSKRC
jgi:hypothetical protein